MRDRFYIYTKYKKQIEGLSYEQKGILFDAILAYMSDESIPEMDVLTQFAFNFIKVDLDENTERYEEKCRVNAANGAKGGRPKKTEESEESEKSEKSERFLENQTVSEKRTVFEKANASEKSRLMDQIDPIDTIDKIDKIDKDIKEKDVSKDTSKKKRFIKPTVEEVRAYCLEKCINVDAESFIDHYESNGWMIGKSPMKDWKACVRKWGRNTEQRNTQSKPQNRFNNFQNSIPFDIAAIEQIKLAQARDG